MRATSTTKNNDNEIIDLHRRGFGQKQTAQELSERTGQEISPKSIARAWKRIGLGANKPQRTVVFESLKETIIRLHNEGFGAKLTSRIIAEQHGVTIGPATVLYHRRRLGLKPHIGSSNGGLAARGKSCRKKTPGEMLVKNHGDQKRRKQREQYRGIKDLPLFSPRNVYKTRYRNDHDFRAKQIEKVKRWKMENPEKSKEHASIYWSRWAKANPEKVKDAERKYQAKPENKVVRNLRRRVRAIIKGRGYSATAIIKGIGCTRSELIAHIESQFEPGMTWDNYGHWHIDHIVPLASGKCDCFDTTVANLSRLNHYTNLQPLWAEDNIRKSDVLPIENQRYGALGPSGVGTLRVTRTTPNKA